MLTSLQTYLRHSAAPLTSLLFVFPLLIVYEAGLTVAPETRNAADLWLRDGLGLLGFTRWWFVPLVTMSVLLSWHYLSRQSWSCRWYVLGGMYCESCLFAVVLVLLATWQTSPATLPAGAIPGRLVWNPERLVAYVGAGIYEEVFFRLVALTTLAAIARLLGLGIVASSLVAIAISSLWFALAHYQTLLPAGEPFHLVTFRFRFLAGVLFGLLYWYRGFGIAVGAHAAYDLVVGVLQTP